MASDMETQQKTANEIITKQVDAWILARDEIDEQIANLQARKAEINKKIAIFI